MEPGKGRVWGLMTTHVDDILIAANESVVELVGRVLDVRFGQLKHKRLTTTTPFKHCGTPFKLTT